MCVVDNTVYRNDSNSCIYIYIANWILSLFGIFNIFSIFVQINLTKRTKLILMKTIILINSLNESNQFIYEWIVGD